MSNHIAFGLLSLAVALLIYTCCLYLLPALNRSMRGSPGPQGPQGDTVSLAQIKSYMKEVLQKAATKPKR